MARLVNLSIDVSKIDKSKLITGKKGTYLNLTVSVNDEKDQFDNDCSAWQSQSKEEREAKEQRNFLGNGRTIWKDEVQVSNSVVDSDKPNVFDDNSKDLPF